MGCDDHKRALELLGYQNPIHAKVRRMEATNLYESDKLSGHAYAGRGTGSNVSRILGPQVRHMHASFMAQTVYHI